MRSFAKHWEIVGLNIRRSHPSSHSCHAPGFEVMCYANTEREGCCLDEEKDQARVHELYKKIVVVKGVFFPTISV
jgi:hypothetical protein